MSRDRPERCVDQADLDPPASASTGLELEKCAARPDDLFQKSNEGWRAI